MCLIAIAHRVSAAYPLVIAANRDEDLERPTQPAQWWADAPDVLGGRDALHGGSWLAVTRSGRFAAVTNLRGAVQRPRSRGALVRDFVTGSQSPLEFASNLETDEYSGFHLIVGQAACDVVYVSNTEAPVVLEPGIYGWSNAPAGEHWPKVARAITKMQSDLDDADELLRFLSTPLNTDRIEDEVFIRGERYGTRSSTVVIATVDEIVLIEQSYARDGAVHTRVHSGSRLARA